MTMNPPVHPTDTPEPPAKSPRQARRAFAAGAIGTAIEYYDFFAYGTAAALVLNTLFFPAFDPIVGTLAAFATFAVGFIMRPIGSFIFGHIGDKLGRKRALVLSLLLMGVATLGIGLLPTYATIGVMAPVLLVLMRLLQGLALGGEWGGATVLAAEYAGPHNRGFVGSLVQLGSPIGLLLSSGAFALVGLMPDDALHSWGWRLPFIASALLVVVGLWIRTRLEESPEFTRAKSSGEMSSKVPAIDVFRYSWRELLTAVAVRFAPDIGFYVFATFIVSYAVGTVGLPESNILLGVAVAAAIEVCLISFFGHLSDRFGRRPLYIAGCLVWIALAFPAFMLIDTGQPALAWIAIILALAVAHAMTWSIGASLNSELFPTRYRLTGANFGLSISGIVAGGPAALIASSLVIWANGSSWGVSGYIVLAGVISLVAIIAAPETSKRSLSVDYTGGIPTVGDGDTARTANGKG
ncbi:MFS transporter [Gulosibacter sp. 10]|uniref:MFS transporter n=1 Tax=Gulosibacter sp. 10 TaxID=1255570 RepID=UPI00097F1C5A|nr:MFS transporter [Gulosibacter sp. 10]SJM63851.1 L-Proline/Glycine betaine transporter ProP [Gulosibacter sp. 10]